MVRYLVVLTLLASLLVGLNIASTLAQEEESSDTGGGAAASDPTSGVSYLDIKPRYFDLTDSDEELQVELETVYGFSPSFTMKVELIGTRNNRSGDWETGLQELKLRPLFLHPIEPFGITAKFGVGVEWFKDLGKTRKGTGKGTDEIAPLVGIGWVPTDKDFIVTLVQYFHSYDENDGVDQVNATGPRLIWIHGIEEINGWGKADLRTRIDHEDDNDFTQTLELQLGTMISDRIGLFGETFLGDSVLDTNQFNWGAGFGLRILY